jgi:hypothetical protein
LTHKGANAPTEGLKALSLVDRALFALDIALRVLGFRSFRHTYKMYCTYREAYVFNNVDFIAYRPVQE